MKSIQSARISRICERLTCFKKNRWLAMALATLVSVTGLIPQPALALQGSYGIHDPSRIIKLNGVYHIWGTGNQIYHITSTDMVNWSSASTVFASGTYPSWITTYTGTGFTGFFWAPDCIYFNNRYWMYYACSTWGSKNSCIGVATSTDLVNWTDQGMVVYSTGNSDFNAIDPAPFVDSSGQLWLSYGSYNSGIKIRQLNTSTGKPLNSTVYSVASPGGRSWSDGEASHVIPHGGYYYLFYNRGGCCDGTNSTYYIIMGRATSPGGPYYDKSGKKMTTSGSGTWFAWGTTHYYGPGSLGYFSENGVEFLTYHYYDGNQNGAPMLAVSHLIWGSDGWPINNPNWIGDGTYKIVNQGNGLCWDDWGCTGGSLQAIAQNTYWGGTCQQWTFSSLLNGEDKITCAVGGLAAEVYGCNPNAGGALDIYGYWGGGCQQWKIDRYSDGSYCLQSVNGNMVVDVPNGTSTTGTQLETFYFNGYWTQRWLIQSP